MSLTVFYTDLRSVASRLERHTFEWQPNLTALDALEHELGLSLAQEIVQDLRVGSREIMVSWWNEETDDHSEIGGVGKLDWLIADHTVLTVRYENEATTQKQIDDSIDWMLEQELQAIRVGLAPLNGVIPT